MGFNIPARSWVLHAHAWARSEPFSRPPSFEAFFAREEVPPHRALCPPDDRRSAHDRGDRPFRCPPPGRNPPSDLCVRSGRCWIRTSGLRLVRASRVVPTDAPRHARYDALRAGGVAASRTVAVGSRLRPDQGAKPLRAAVGQGTVPERRLGRRVRPRGDRPLGRDGRPELKSAPARQTRERSEVVTASRGGREPVPRRRRGRCRGSAPGRCARARRDRRARSRTRRRARARQG